MKRGIFVIFSIVALGAAAFSGILAADESSRAVSGASDGRQAVSFTYLGEYQARVELLGRGYRIDVAFLEPVVAFYKGSLSFLQKVNAPAAKYFYETVQATQPLYQEYVGRYLPRPG